MCTRKQEIQDWLTRLRVAFEPTMTRAQRLQLCKTLQVPAQFRIDTVMARHGHKVLRLPPYHADLKCVEKVKAVEADYWKSDIAVDEEMDRIIINLADSDTDDDNDTDTADKNGDVSDVSTVSGSDTTETVDHSTDNTDEFFQVVQLYVSKFM